MSQTTTTNFAPIGIFDSGIGGLSVLQHVRRQLPGEDLIYFADSGFAPYGGKPEAFIIERSLSIAAFLLEQGCKALVVACNTATATAIHILREHYPQCPIVGIEPGLKPAASLTKTGVVAVLATDRTLKSDKFHKLHDQLTAASKVRFITQACTGLADQIEKEELDSATTHALVRQYLKPLADHPIDTLVLGCTHYPFVQPLIEEEARSLLLPALTIIDTGEPVARQLTRLLAQHAIRSNRQQKGGLRAYTSNSVDALASAFEKLLQLRPPIEKSAV